MKKTILLLLALFIASIIQATETQTAQVATAGTLGTIVQSYNNTVTNLTVTGSIDARDFVTLRQMPLLDTLDLSDATIVAYSGTDGTDVLNEISNDYPANTIPYYAFYDDMNLLAPALLTTIILPNSTTAIGDYAFSFNTLLESVSMSSSLTTINSSAFQYCLALTTITIPSSVTSIAYNAFGFCISLKTVAFNAPSSLTTIGSFAFSLCYSLSSITLPSSVSSIDDGAFSDDSSLTSIQIPHLVSTLNVFLFANCNYLETVTFETPSSLKYIEEEAFDNCTTLKTLAIPLSVTSIGSAAFLNCSSLKAIAIPSLVTTIGSSAFQNCTSLTTVDLPPTFTTIRDKTFAYDTLLTTITLPSLVTNIGNYAFQSCKSITSITIPSSTTTIGESAFANCTRLTAIYANPSVPVDLSNSPTVFGTLASTGNCTLYVPYGSSVAYKDASQWKDFTTSESSNGFYVTSNNVLLDKTAGSSSTIIVTANVDWSFTTDQSWLTISQNYTGTNHNGTITFTTNTLNTGDKKTATVTVHSAGYDNQTIIVNQSEGIMNKGDVPVLYLSRSHDDNAPVVDQKSTVVNLYIDYNIQDHQYFRFMPTVSGTYSVSISNDNVNSSMTDDNGVSFAPWDLIAGHIYYLGLHNYNSDQITATVTITGGGLQGFVYTGSGNWENNANWNWAVMPEARNNVTVQGNLTIDKTVKATNVTILPDASLTILDGDSLKYSTFTMLSDTAASASLISSIDEMPAVVKQVITEGRNWYVSSPVSDALSGSIKLTSTNKLWDYTETTASWNDISSTSTLLNVMTGYVANIQGNDTISFEGGYVNTGVQSINLSRSAASNEKQGFNLIGNPYPSCVNWDMAQTTGVEASIWYRTQNKLNDYVFDTYNHKSNIGTNNNGKGDVTGIILPMQAVWVKVDSLYTTGSVTFDNSMRCHPGAGNTLKASKEQSDIRLQISNGKSSDETILVFNTNATNGIDNYDSPKMFNNGTNTAEIYSPVATAKLVINALQSIETNPIIPLGYKTSKAGTFTLSATEIAGINSSVILEDKRLNISQDLAQSPCYTFTSDSVDNSDRFVLHVKSDAGTETSTALKMEQSQPSIIVYTKGGLLNVKTSADNANGTIIVFNILGQTVAKSAIAGTVTTLELPSVGGAYFVTVKTDKKIETKKIIVQ